MNKSQTEAGMKLTFDFNNMMESAIGSQGIKEKELELLEEKASESPEKKYRCPDAAL